MKTRKTVTFLLTVTVLTLIGLGSFLYFKDTSAPTISLAPGQGPVGADTHFSAHAEDPSGLRDMTATLLNNGKRTVLAQQTMDHAPEGELLFTLDKVKGLKDGPVSIELEAVDASLHRLNKGNVARTTFTLELDRKKPRISVNSLQHNLNRGGCGAISYTVNETVRESGVRVGGRFFPGHKLPSGAYACLFAFPWDMSVGEFRPTLEAEDPAGNRRVRTFAFHVNNRKFKNDTLNLPDRFLQAKMPQFEDDYPNQPNLLAVYLKVNRETRAKDRETLKALASSTVDRPLWHGAFLRLPNAANRASFADHRTYKYRGEVVDEQTHMGIDLASIRNAKVPAANAGRVARTGFNGIYGENVVLDHGMGLMTLYAHLSQIDVAPGDEVQKGQIIGRTGVTGLAGGDHLHYGVYASGVAVNPVEWWDGTWIRNNVKERMGQ